jgi:vitamin B12 transporter
MRAVFCWLTERFVLLAACATLLASRARAQAAPLVTGRVTDASTGVALSGVDLWLTDGAHTLSGTDGRFRLRALEPGPTQLQARRVGYIVTTHALTLRNGDDLTFTLALTRLPTTLTGVRVLDTATSADRTRLSRDVIAQGSARDLGELLRGVPGVMLVPRGGPGAPVTVSIRGSSANQVLVLLDGTPLNDPVTGVADVSAIDPAIIERVDIVRGAHSARYGGQALGGVIAVTTLRAGTVQPTLTLGSGQWGERRASSTVSAERGNGTSRLAAQISSSWQRVAGNFIAELPPARGGGQTRRANADVERIAVSSGVTLQRERTLWDLRGDVATIDRGMPGSIVQPSLAARQTQHRVGGALSLTHAPNDWTSLRTAVTVQDQHGRFVDASPPFTAPYDQRQRVTTLVGTASAATRWNGMALTTGVESRTLQVTGTTIASGARTRVALGGAWAGVSRSITTPVARVELAAATRADVGTLWRSAFVSPDIHLTAQRRALRLTTGWRSAFAAPSLGDLFFQEGVQVRANPALRPERVRGEWHATTEWLPRRVLGLETSASVAAYRGDIDDLIIWSPDFRFVWQPDNFDVTRRGVDVSTRIAVPSNAVALTLTGSRVDVRYRGAVLSGQVLYRPQHTGAATLDAARGAYDAQLALQAVGVRRTVVASDINRLPAFQIVQARLARHVRRGAVDARVRISVDNLLDQRVATLVDFPMPGRTWALDVTVQPRRRPAARSSTAAF